MDTKNNYFSDEELSCKCCGKNKFLESTKQKLNNLREVLGFPFIVNSAYRCEKYNKKMGFTQTHATGQAVDISCSHQKAFRIIQEAPEFGFTGIGVSQKGDVSSRFIHIDDLNQAEGRPRPHIWSY